MTCKQSLLLGAFALTAIGVLWYLQGDGGENVVEKPPDVQTTDPGDARKAKLAPWVDTPGNGQRELFAGVCSAPNYKTDRDGR